MKKIIAISLSAALLLSATPSSAFTRKSKARVEYTPDRVLVVRRPNAPPQFYIPLVTPLFTEVVVPVIGGVLVGVVSGTRMVFGGVEYVLTNLTHPPRSCVARDSTLYRC